MKVPAIVGLIISQIVTFVFVLFVHTVIDKYRVRSLDNHAIPGDLIIAPIWRRILATVIDSCLIFLIFILHTAIFSVINETYSDDPHIFLGTYGFTYCYYGYAWTNRYGQTIGKSLMAIKIVKQNGKQMKLFDAVLRGFGIIIGVLSFYLGFIWVFIDKNNQGWHDKIAGTYVVID